jgi:hypothetical protein
MGCCHTGNIIKHNEVTPSPPPPVMSIPAAQEEGIEKLRFKGMKHIVDSQSSREAFARFLCHVRADYPKEKVNKNNKSLFFSIEKSYDVYNIIEFNSNSAWRDI